MLEDLTERLDGFLKFGTPGYDCAVYHNGKCIYRRFNGFSDRENNILMNGKETYNLYSCSKVITCVAALRLYEKGLFDLNDDLCDYMPEFSTMYVKDGDGLRRAKKNIKIIDLFRMTAGFSYNTHSPMLERCRKETNGRCQTREVMRYLSQEPLLFEPGERYEYSLCHDVLAALIEVISGKKFGLYVKENIFIPLNMEKSTFLPSEKEIENLCSQYKYSIEDSQSIKIEKTNGYRLGKDYESGGAGCVSCVDDYVKFLEAVRTYKLLKPETVSLMTTNHLLDEQKKYFALSDEYGYGLGVRCERKKGKIRDFGWDGAAGSYLFIDIKNKLTAFYAQHVLNSPIYSMHVHIKDDVEKVLI